MKVKIWNKKEGGVPSWIMEFTLPNEKPEEPGEYILREEDIPSEILWKTHKYNLSPKLRERVLEREKFRAAIQVREGWVSTMGGFNEKGEFCDINGFPIIKNLDQLEIIQEEMNKRLP